MSNNYDVAVAYRVCPFGPTERPVFGDDKFKLTALALKSFKDSISGLKVKVFAILDSCPPEYESLFRDTIPAEDLEIISVEGGGNRPTYKMQLDILRKQNDAEVVYLAEDDYYYFPDTFYEMVKLLKENDDVDFVTPYDHLDMYTIDLHNHPVEIKAFNNRHWRTANSTCLTYMTDKRTLEKTVNALMTFAKKNHDASMWLSLTKFKLSPLTMLRYFFTNWGHFGLVAKAWYHSGWYVLFYKKRKLWAPVPTIAAHMMSAFMPPSVDWDTELRNAIKKYKLQ